MSIELRRARNRQMLIFLLVSFGMLVLLGRLYYWQILQSTSGYNLAKLANDEHISNQILNAPRGIIYDAQGRILATNVVRDDVYVEPLQFPVDHPDNTASDLANLINTLHSVLPSVSVQKLQRAFDSGLQTVRIASGIDPTQSQRLRNLQLPDVFLEPRTWRTYPAGELAAQVLGFVSQNENNNAGVYGIELQYNTLLAGKPGSFTAETDLSGNPLVVGASSGQPAVSGANLTLTIDSAIEYDVQTALEAAVKQLQAESGSIVVINARTGAIVAMAGAPTFDPNYYGQYASKLGCLNSQEVFFNPVLDRKSVV